MAIPLNGEMSQNKRLSSLNKFKAKSRSILVSGRRYIRITWGHFYDH
jgi:hypothetical protein